MTNRKPHHANCKTIRMDRHHNSVTMSCLSVVVGRWSTRSTNGRHIPSWISTRSLFLHSLTYSLALCSSCWPCLERVCCHKRADCDSQVCLAACLSLHPASVVWVVDEQPPVSWLTHQKLTPWHHPLQRPTIVYNFFSTYGDPVSCSFLTEEEDVDHELS